MSTPTTPRAGACADLDPPGDEGYCLVNRDPWLRALIILLVFIAGSYLASLAWTVAVQFADILLLLLLAWVLSFALEPITSILETRTSMPRLAGGGNGLSGSSGVLSLLIVLVVPEFAMQVSQIGMDLPSTSRTLGVGSLPARPGSPKRGIEIDAADPAGL